jgi:hypothetical protein
MMKKAQLISISIQNLIVFGDLKLQIPAFEMLII